MSVKFVPKNPISNETMAKHLKKPEGEIGKQIADLMSKGNKAICLNTYDQIVLKPNLQILEIGMANGFFVKSLFDKEGSIAYTGVDYAEDMVNDACVLNETLMQTKPVKFIHGEVSKLPFEDRSFDVITTTNTIYFWPTPLEDMKGLFRLLKSGGQIVIGYRPKEILDQMAVTNFGFEKYTIEAVEKLLETAGFKNISTTIIDEPEMDMNGSVVKLKGAYSLAWKE